MCPFISRSYSIHYTTTAYRVPGVTIVYYYFLFSVKYVCIGYAKKAQNVKLIYIYIYLYEVNRPKNVLKTKKKIIELRIMLRYKHLFLQYFTPKSVLYVV